MELGKKKITFGRFKNKTFEQVFEADEDYCRLVYKHHTNYRGDTEDFRTFLEAKFEVDTQSEPGGYENNQDIKRMYAEQDLIKKVKVNEFLSELTPDHKIEFDKIIRTTKPRISVCSVHSESKLRKTNGFLGVFYGLFFQKYLFNLRNENASLSRVKKMINIFPIQLNNDYCKYCKDLEIFEYLDQTLTSEVCVLLQLYYFQLPEDISTEIKHLFRLIDASETENKELKSLLDVHFIVSSKGEYLAILKKYMFFYSIYKEYGDVKYTREMFDKCRQLDPQDLNNRKNASSDLIVDDTFFTCSKSYRRFIFFKGDIFNLLEDIHNVARFSEIYYGVDVKKMLYKESDIVKESLCDIMKYVDRFNIDNSILFPTLSAKDYSVRVDQLEDNFSALSVKEKTGVPKLISIPDTKYAIDTCFLSGQLKLVTDDSLVRLKYSTMKKNSIGEFYELIIWAVLFKERHISKVVIYNALRGEESTMEVPSNTEDIKNFIRKYRDPKSLLEYIRQEDIQMD